MRPLHITHRKVGIHQQPELGRTQLYETQRQSGPLALRPGSDDEAPSRQASAVLTLTAL